MARLLAQAERLAEGDSSLLLLGETGSGKEWLARRIHAASPRCDGPFVAINCAALPETLFESEMFGHERGAFTGAERRRRGHFELADRGTLFLDEIGETPLHLQAKLLRAVERGELQRVGGETPVAVDVRILAATHRDLEADVAGGRFRRDLYYRLAVATLALPPLRERRDEIEGLALDVLRRCRTRSRPVESFTPEAMRALAAYDWPGNVRELASVVERAVQLSEGTELGTEDLPLRVVVAGRAPGRVLAAVLRWPEDRWLDRPLPDVRRELVATLEREYLRGQLRRTGGDLADTARRSGIAPRSLFNKLQELGLDKREFQQGGEEAEPRRRRPSRTGRS
jgi:DNA-binding NtrC family response regulator